MNEKIRLPTKLLKNKKCKDKVRLKINKYLKNNNINIYHKDFFTYINNRDFLNELYIILCCGFYDTNETIKCLKKIINYFNKYKSIITFRELFQQDIEWIPYFSENAYPDGTLKTGELREGVSRIRCDDILKIKKLLIDNKSIDNSIKIYDNINIKIFSKMF